MNARQRIQTAADLLVSAHETGSVFATASGEAPETLAEAYAVQDAVARRLWIAGGDAIRGWKTGGPSAEATPIAAPIRASRILASPAELVGKNFHFIAVEAELAYTLRQDLPPREMPYVEAEVAAAVASVHVAIEVCDSRLRDWRTADALWKLADMQMNAALVVGSPERDWQRIIPERQVAIIEIDSRICAETSGSHPCGNPVRLLPWLANHCALRCGGLHAGDVVTTGAWTGMHMVEAGAKIIVRFPGIGEARVHFQ